MKVTSKIDSTVDDRIVKTVKHPPMRPIDPLMMYPDHSKTWL